MAVYYYKYKDGSQWTTHFASNKEKLKKHRNNMKSQFEVSPIMEASNGMASVYTDFDPHIR